MTQKRVLVRNERVPLRGGDVAQAVKTCKAHDLGWRVARVDGLLGTWNPGSVHRSNQRNVRERCIDRIRQRKIKISKYGYKVRIIVTVTLGETNG